MYTSAPQIYLRLGTKLRAIPGVFTNEIKNEELLIKSLEIPIDYSLTNEHERTKKIMKTLEQGYEYLYKNYSSFYGHRYFI